MNLRVQNIDLIPDDIVVDVLIQPKRSIDEDAYLLPDITQQQVIREGERAGDCLGFLLLEELVGHLELYVCLEHESVTVLGLVDALQAEQDHPVSLSNRARVEQVQQLQTLMSIVHHSHPE